MLWKRGCAHLKQQEPNVDAWLATWEQRKVGTAEADWDAALFSHHTLRTCHNGEVRKVRVPIEPLVGLLRHPKYYCIVPGFDAAGRPPSFMHGRLWKHNRDYLLPFWDNETLPVPGRRSLFFDMGASLYNDGLGGASQKWFIDEYARRGIHFDRIFAWELKQHTDSEILSRLSGSTSDAPRARGGSHSMSGPLISTH